MRRHRPAKRSCPRADSRPADPLHRAASRRTLRAAFGLLQAGRWSQATLCIRHRANGARSLERFDLGAAAAKNVLQHIMIVLAETRRCAPMPDRRLGEAIRQTLMQMPASLGMIERYRELAGIQKIAFERNI